jgi:hypothetical protein
MNLKYKIKKTGEIVKGTRTAGDGFWLITEDGRKIPSSQVKAVIPKVKR